MRRPRRARPRGIPRALPRRRPPFPPRADVAPTSLPPGIGAIEVLSAENRALLRARMGRDYRITTARELV